MKKLATTFSYHPPYLDFHQTESLKQSRLLSKGLFCEKGKPESPASYFETQDS